MGFWQDVMADYEAAVKQQGKAPWPRIVMEFFHRMSFRAAVLYRIGHAARRRRIKAIGGLMDRLIHKFCHADISTSAEIGPGLRMPHPRGVVIGNRVRIGRRAYILQDVTIGGSVDKSRGEQDQPYLGDDVLLGAGAKLLGPVIVGSRVTVGANAVVVGDLPDDSTAVGVPARIIRQGGRRLSLLEQGGELADLLEDVLRRLEACEKRLAGAEAPPGPPVSPAQGKE